MTPERKQLESLVQQLNSDGLDDLVHDLVSQQASSINNEGMESQVRYVVEQLGIQDAIKEIRKVVEEQ